jgi:uncharacterized RmlC-like cupin family protein
MEEHLQPRVVRAQQRLRQAALQTAGVLREQAFSTEDAWVGMVTTEPGEMSAWHHHGDHDTYAYVVSGLKRIEYGPGGTRSLIAGPDDFHSPPQGTDAPGGQSKRGTVTLDRVSAGEWPSHDQCRRAAVSGSTDDGPGNHTARPAGPDMATHPGRDARKIPLGVEVGSERCSMSSRAVGVGAFASATPSSSQPPGFVLSCLSPSGDNSHPKQIDRVLGPSRS